jgi:5-formyltetrahydrofolate cyclo-ligase
MAHDGTGGWRLPSLRAVHRTAHLVLCTAPRLGVFPCCAWCTQLRSFVRCTAKVIAEHYPYLPPCRRTRSPFAMTPNRNDIRRAMRAQRRQITPAQRVAAARRFAIAADRAYLLRPGSRIAVYQPYGHEADVQRITQRAWQRGCHVYLPVVTHQRRFEMKFVRFEPDTPLELNAFGIPEPRSAGSDRISVRYLDVIFMPLVAFDHHGSRLGSGAGFYDRALRHLHASRRWRRPKLVGVAYAQQHIESLSANRWDIPMDAVITESYLKRFNPLRLGSTS